MQWSQDPQQEPFEMQQYRIYAASDGGPIACVRDSRRILSQNKVSVTKNSLRIFSAAGVLMQEIKMELNPKLMDFGWTADERLVCVFDNGTLRFYGIDGGVNQMSLGMPNVVQARIWDDGLVAMTSTLDLVVVDSFADKSAVRKFEQVLLDLPTQWIVVPPKFSRSRQVEVIFSLDNAVYSTDGFTVVDQLIENGTPSEMNLSNNGKLIALYIGQKILVYTIDFKQKLLEFPCKTSTPPLQIAWCGSDSLLVHWEGVLLVIGPYGDWIKYSYETPIYVHSESDGARIISEDKTEFLEKVSPATEDSLKFGSTAAPALLYDAYDHFEKQDASADEIIRTIKDRLREAVCTCIEAAGYEFEPKVQRALLKAASFGRAFLKESNSSDFVKMCEDLRILNALRQSEVGIPLTFSQYRSLSMDKIIDKLLRRNQHLLCIKISSFLKLSTDNILVHWSCQKMKDNTIGDEMLADVIIDRLKSIRRPAFAKIADAALKSGRPLLASILIDHETKIADQIPLLLQMEEYKNALNKSIISGDTELVYQVIFHLKRKMQTADFLKTVASFPESAALFKVLMKEVNPQLLTDYFYQEDLRYDHALHLVSQAKGETNAEKKIELFKNASQMIKNDRMLTTRSRLMDEMALLQSLHSKFESEFNQQFKNLSVNETVKKLIAFDKESLAQKMKSEFKIPDKRFWYLKVDAYSGSRDFENLEKFARSKKSPIGYEPFVDACVKQGNLLEAKKYILKCDVNRRADLYLKIGALKEAAESALSTKNVAMLQLIRSRSQNSAFNQELDAMIVGIKGK